MSITIAAKFKDMKWGICQSLDKGSEDMPPRKILKICPPEIESEAGLTETIKLQLNAVAVLATCSEYCTITAK